MNKRNTKKGSKRPVNLTLSRDTVRKGNFLKETLNRPSFSNVVEYLIEEESKKTSPAAA